MHPVKKVLILDCNKTISSIIQKIIEKPNKDEPFYICDVGNLISKITNWKKLMPRVEVFYATKCNDSWIVLETFAALGLGFDCASKEEIRKVLGLGVSPDKIVFSNTTKMVSHITYANEVGVTVMTFDNEAELHKIKSHYPNAELVIRIKCDDPSATYVLGLKFGVPPDTKAYRLLKLAKSLDLNVIGVHFHVGSGSRNPNAYYNAIAAARKVFKMGNEMGYKFKLLDIGGGYPGETFNPIDKVAKLINRGIEEFFPEESIKIIAEPGKYACNTAFKLVTQIHSKNILKTSNNEKVKMYYVDVGVFNNLFCSLYQEYYIIKPASNSNLKETFPSIIWGSSSEILDKLTETFDYLPDLHVGEWVIVEEAGGYSLSISCDYNRFPSPKLYAVISKEDWLILNCYNKPCREDLFTSSIEKFLSTKD